MSRDSKCISRSALPLRQTPSKSNAIKSILAIAFVCRQTYRECSSVYYGRNTFHITDGWAPCSAAADPDFDCDTETRITLFSEAIGSQNTTNINKLSIDLSPSGSGSIYFPQLATLGFQLQVLEIGCSLGSSSWNDRSIHGLEEYIKQHELSLKVILGLRLTAATRSLLMDLSQQLPDSISYKDELAMKQRAFVAKINQEPWTKGWKKAKLIEWDEDVSNTEKCDRRRPAMMPGTDIRVRTDLNFWDDWI